MNGCGEGPCNPICATSFPGPPPTHYADAGVNCAAIPPSNRVSFSIPIQQGPAVDPKEPLQLEWPPNVEEINYEDTGPRYDLLAQIPDQIVPQVVTFVAKPEYSPAMTHENVQHPLCPDGQFHMRIDPSKLVIPPRELRMPDVPCPPRGPPQRPWIQCVENTLLSDQVRRPLARCCHQRPLPPLVIPQAKLEELKLMATERERKAQAVQDWHQQRECLRLKSRQRQGKWNYTVESLLERKKDAELAKEAAEKEDTRKLMEEVKREKAAQSSQQIARANKLILYRKGLIRDFHSALAYSKMMQENERSISSSNQDDQKDLPVFMQKMHRKMMNPNWTRPDHPLKVEKKQKPINQKLLASLKKVECRTKEHQAEINNELCSMKQLIADCAPELPEAYIKYMTPPVCDPEVNNIKAARQKYAWELYDSISDKLAADAYIESHEKEIDRQACEFAAYKRQVDAIRKAKEKQLIDEKVAYNIRKSEAAAKVLVQMQKKKQTRANEYDQLKDQWEAEWEDKKEEKKVIKEQVMDRVVQDFEKRKRNEEWKRCELDPARQWARERLVAEENFERECEMKSDKRKLAEELVIYNKAQASAKECKAKRASYLDNVWGAKMKKEYVDEMKEMKAYAYDCIEDWKAKGRSPHPMIQAMKKWDYDSGMYPYLFKDDSIPSEEQMQKQLQDSENSKTQTCGKYQTTANRLGFASGGS